MDYLKLNPIESIAIEIILNDFNIFMRFPVHVLYAFWS